VDLLRGIRQLLYGQGYTIKGVQRILKQDGLRFVQSIGRGERTVASPPPGADEADEGALFEAESSAPTTPALREDSGLGRPAPAPEMPRNVPPSANSEPRSAGLSPADVQRLRAALGELVECERVLAALRIFDDLQSERPT
jgi:hypothetical protein